MEYREANQKQVVESTNIADYKAGDILELTNDDDERFVAIVVNTNWVHKDGNVHLGIYDLETDCIFEDLVRYKVVKKRSGFLQLTD